MNWRRGLFRTRDRPHTILIEDKASGTQLIQDLKADGVYAVTAHQPPSGTDKIMRLHAQTAAFENGLVLLPATAPWLIEFVNELTSFPGTRHDDQVDSATQALDHLRTYERDIIRIPPEVLARARGCADLLSTSFIKVSQRRQPVSRARRRADAQLQLPAGPRAL